MGDYIPLDELEKFMASCNDATTKESRKGGCREVKIQANNMAHKMLSKMGWEEVISNSFTLED